MRVLHLTAGNLYGGIETLLVTLARYRDLGAPMAPSFALCFPGRLRDELLATGVPVHDLGAVRFRHPWFIWTARSRLASILHKERPDVVICHGCWPHALFAPVIRRHRIALTYWAHDAPTGRHWLERLAARTPPDLVLANSHYTAAALPRLFPQSLNQVLYLPVPSPNIPDRPAVRAHVRNELQTPHSSIVIVMASRLERWKGHTLLLDALSRITDLPDWVCWVAGGSQRPHEQTYLEELTTSVARLGLQNRIRFLGQRNDVPQLLTAADIHCQPNTGPEPFGIAFIEALYADLPVVTTDMGGGAEIVDETCGILVPPGDAEKVSTALRSLIGDVEFRRRLGSGGPGRAASLCGPATQLRVLGNALASADTLQLLLQS
jgi:glycosyltransferase involved in cell wall biosynthesis